MTDFIATDGIKLVRGGKTSNVGFTTTDSTTYAAAGTPKTKELRRVVLIIDETNFQTGDKLYVLFKNVVKDKAYTQTAGEIAATSTATAIDADPSSVNTTDIADTSNVSDQRTFVTTVEAITPPNLMVKGQPVIYERTYGDNWYFTVKFDRAIDLERRRPSAIIEKLQLASTTKEGDANNISPKNVEVIGDDKTLKISLPNNSNLIAGKFVYVAFKDNAIKDKISNAYFESKNKFITKILAKPAAPIADTSSSLVTINGVYDFKEGNAVDTFTFTLGADGNDDYEFVLGSDVSGSNMWNKNADNKDDWLTKTAAAAGDDKLTLSSGEMAVAADTCDEGICTVIKFRKKAEATQNDLSSAPSGAEVIAKIPQYAPPIATIQPVQEGTERSHCYRVLIRRWTLRIQQVP